MAGQRVTLLARLYGCPLWVALCIICVTLAPVAAEEIALQRPVPPQVQEIEVVYVENRAPTVSLKRAATPPAPAPFRPSSPTVDLLTPLAGQPFGDCQARTERTPSALALHLHVPDNARCGYGLLLQQPGAQLDALSYDTLYLHGETTGRITLALVDEAAQRREENVLLTSVTGHFDLRVPLGPAAQHLDLRRLVALVVFPEATDISVVFTALALEQTPPPRQTGPGHGFWVWEYRQALTDPAATLETCQRQGCRRLLVQMPALEDPAELWTAYTQFLRAAHVRGIEAFALDGYPEAIHTPEPLLHKLRRLLALTAGQYLAGVQLDIEPYVLEDFFVDDTGFMRYLGVIEQVREALAGQARLSVVMPFWLTAQLLRGRPVAFAVMDRADEVAIMSYRTDLNALRAIAEDTLRYGVLARVPVWLAVETVALPLERHVILKREPRRELADAYLDQTGQRLVLEPPPPAEGLTWFRVHDRTTVWPERLTFAGQSRQQVRAAVATILDTVAHPSLAGVLIHDLNGFLALPE